MGEAREGALLMLFNSFVFVAFFIVAYAGYLALQGRLRWQNLWLLGASYVFYGWWDVRFLGLIALSTVVDFVVGQRVHAAEGRARWRWL